MKDDDTKRIIIKLPMRRPDRWFVLGFLLIALAAINGGLVIEHGNLLHVVVGVVVVGGVGTHAPKGLTVTAQFFGEPWDVPAVGDATRVETPVGQRCYGCGEAVAEGDRGWMRWVARWIDESAPEPTAVQEPVHAECELLPIMGHQFGICPCNGYDSNRASARLLWQRVFGDREGRNSDPCYPVAND